MYLFKKYKNSNRVNNLNWYVTLRIPIFLCIIWSLVFLHIYIHSNPINSHLHNITDIVHCTTPGMRNI